MLFKGQLYFILSHCHQRTEFFFDSLSLPTLASENNVYHLSFLSQESLGNCNSRLCSPKKERNYSFEMNKAFEIIIGSRAVTGRGVPKATCENFIIWPC